MSTDIEVTAASIVDDLLVAAKRQVTPADPSPLNLAGLEKGDLRSAEAFISRNWSAAMAKAIMAELRHRLGET